MTLRSRQMVSWLQIFVWWGGGHSWVKILSCRYQCSDPVSSVNLQLLHLQHIAAGRESHSMYGCHNDKHATDWVHNPGFRSSCSGCQSVWGAGRVEIPLFFWYSHTQHLNCLEFLKELQNIWPVLVLWLLAKHHSWVWCSGVESVLWCIKKIWLYD